MKVRNMTSERTGREVANQFIIEHDGQIYFQSYKTIIAKIDEKRRVILDHNAEYYSKTTSKYLYTFLANYAPTVASREQAKQDIKNGCFWRMNLNA